MKKLTDQEARERIDAALASDNVEFSPTDEVEDLSEWVNKVLDAISDVWGIEPLFVSDRTAVADFTPTGEAVSALGKKLGVLVHRNDYLIDVAKRLKLSEVN